MLAYILAVLVGTSSVGLYLWAFFFPEIHRKQDFIWSGVGLFYALFLWLYARQVTGGILVGQTTSVALLGWFGWETFKLRRQLVPIDRSNTVTPNPTKRQNQRESNRVLTVAKPTAIAPLSSPSPTASAPTPAPTPVDTTIISSTPLAQIKVPPATTDRAAPTVSRAAPPTPTAKVMPSKPTIFVDSRSIEMPPPTPSTKSSPVTASPQQISQSTSQPIPVPAVNLTAQQEEAWIKLEVKPTPSKPLGTPVQPPTIASPAPAQSPAVVPEVINQNISSEPTETATELESENWA